MRCERRLVQALDAGPVACVKALGIPYPFPGPESSFWTTDTGVVLTAVAREHDLDAGLLHTCSELSARVIFGTEWVQAAKEEISKRTLVAATPKALCDALIAQYMDEQHVDAETALLKLCAASTSWTDDSCSEFKAYMFCSAAGVHITCDGDRDFITEPDNLTPQEVQESLTSDEQLTFLVLCSTIYDRVAHGQPLPGRNLTLCSECSVGAGTNYDGDPEDVLVGDQYCAHASCCVAPSDATPKTSVDEKVVCCSGIVAYKGTWYLRASKWSSPSTHVGLIHPAALPSMIQDANDLVLRGQWKQISQPARSVTLFCGASSEFFAHLSMYGHLLNTGQVPGVYLDPGTSCIGAEYSSAEDMATHAPCDLFPFEGSLAQANRRKAATCLLSASVEDTLKALRVYHEPSFSHMVANLRAAGVTDVDGCLRAWVAKRMPLLTGDVNTQATITDAAKMHSSAASAVCSLKTRQRMWSKKRVPEHWVVSQVDPVFPESSERYMAYLQDLGVHNHACVPRPTHFAATPDLARDEPRHIRPTVGANCTFAVRVMLNPSLHLQTLTRAIADAQPRWDLKGAEEHFLRHEIAPIGTHITKHAAEEFRRACIRCPLYGRLFLWMTLHNYTHSYDVHDDCSSLLAQPGPKRPSMKAVWGPVTDLQKCTCADLVVLGCGSLQYWHKILTPAPTFLFETSLQNLQDIATTVHPLPDNVHVVPCDWTDDLDISSITTRSVVVVSDGLTALNVGKNKEVYHMQHQKSTDSKSIFMTPYTSTSWLLKSNNERAEQMAAHAYKMLQAM